MEWTRSETIALASASCTHCHGLGIRFGRQPQGTPCNCVLRAVFRACYGRFRRCVEKEKQMSATSYDFIPGGHTRFSWGRKEEEYIADFTLVSQRVLTEAEYCVFKYHFLYGASWKLCCRRLSLDRGKFFHTIYRIQQKLGRAFRELEPYSLFPIDSYFRSDLDGAPVRACVDYKIVPITPPKTPLRLLVPARRPA
jgi:hypothetical protein